MKYALILAASVAFSCTAYRAQHADPADAASFAPDAKVEAATTPAAGLEPDVAEGADPHAGHNTRFVNAAADPASARRKTLLASINDLKADLAAEGKYDCCVKPGCNECVLNAGECHCRRVVEKDGPCCGECTQGWIEGRGVVEGVSREQILEHLGCVRSLYEKKLPEGEEMPGTIKP